VIHLDTSALIAALSGSRAQAAVLRRFVSDGQRLGASTLVLYSGGGSPGPSTSCGSGSAAAVVSGGGIRRG
jgi:hypothetical protein